MKILECSTSNFGSFRHIMFDFSDTGLALVHGPTGSGKSTLQDTAIWTLFGITAKGGNVDDVRNWKSGENNTIGSISVQFSNKAYIITRSRAPNDLYWQEDGLATKKRGKDMADTQKQINELLGVDATTFMLATCFNDASPAYHFFTAGAKDRREVFYKIADLSLSQRLEARAASARKTAKKELEQLENTVDLLSSKLEQLIESKETTQAISAKWERDKSDALIRLEAKHCYFEKEKISAVEALETKYYRFEEDRTKKIEELVDKLDSLEGRMKNGHVLEARLKRAQDALPPHCSACGRVNNTSNELEAAKTAIEHNNSNVKKFTEYSCKLRDLQESENPYKDPIDSAKKVKNHYNDQIAERRLEQNPFVAQITRLQGGVITTQSELEKSSGALRIITTKHKALEQLGDLAVTLRSTLLEAAVRTIQDSTNACLSKYFESEFQVSFTLMGSDSLEVKITKNGYPCVYRQLSKGQRQLLRLCFSVSVMTAAANNVGIGFNLLMFDEACDGFDVELKLKAFRMFEDLSKAHSSVLVIDHTPEFNELFINKYKVSIVSDESSVEYEKS